MTDDATGSLDGIGWIDVDMPELPHNRMVAGTGNHPGPVRILHPEGEPPHPRRIATWRTNSKNVYDLSAGVGFRPFDEIEAFPGRRIAYHQSAFLTFDMAAWVRLHRTIDPRVAFSYDGGRLEASVETVRNGSIARVRRRLARDLTFDEAIVPILRYFERRCPPPPAEHMSMATCGPHVNALLSHLTAIGVTHVDRWCRRVEARTSGEKVDDLGINVAMLRGMPEVDRITLRTGRDTNAVQCRVEMAYGHSIQDDDTGTTVELRASVPETLLAGAKGRDVTDVIDMPWLRGLTIRTARHGDGAVMLRAAAPNEPLVLARDVVDDGEAVAAQLRDLTAEEGGLITMMDEDVRPLLETMTPDALLAVLLILLREKRMDLDDHGRPGWSLQMFGLSIVITRRPSGRLSDVVDAVLRTTAQD